MASTKSQATVTPFSEDCSANVHSESNPTPRVIPITPHNGSILPILQTPSRVSILPWGSSDQSGKLIGVAEVTPGIAFESTRLKDTITHTTNLLHFGLNYRLWRGTLKYTIQIISNKYYQGQLYACFIPDTGESIADKATPVMSKCFNLNGITINMADENTSTLTIPFVSTRDYLPTAGPDSTARTGRFAIFVLNPLIVGQQNPTIINMNLDLSAGDDFEYAYPQPFTGKYSSAGTIDVPKRSVLINQMDRTVNAPTTERKTYSAYAPSACQAKLDSSAETAGTHNILEQEYLATSRDFSFNTSDIVGDHHDFKLPSSFFTDEQAPLGLRKYHALLRSDFEVDIKLTSTPFHQGVILAVYTPDVDADPAEFWATGRNLPHVFLDLNNQTRGTFTIPYSSVGRYLHNVDDEDMGKITLYLYNRIFAAVGATTSISGMVGLRMTNSDMNIRKVIAQMNPNEGSPVDPINYVGELNEWVQQHPQVSPSVIQKSERHGPPHRPMYIVDMVLVTTHKDIAGKGAGRTKAIAKQQAAENILSHFKVPAITNQINLQDIGNDIELVDPNEHLGTFRKLELTYGPVIDLLIDSMAFTVEQFIAILLEVYEDGEYNEGRFYCNHIAFTHFDAKLQKAGREADRIRLNKWYAQYTKAVLANGHDEVDIHRPLPACVDQGEFDAPATALADETTTERIAQDTMKDVPVNTKAWMHTENNLTELLHRPDAVAFGNLYFEVPAATDTGPAYYGLTGPRRLGANQERLVKIFQFYSGGITYQINHGFPYDIRMITHFKQRPIQSNETVTDSFIQTQKGTDEATDVTSTFPMSSWITWNPVHEYCKTIHCPQIGTYPLLSTTAKKPSDSEYSSTIQLLYQAVATKGDSEYYPISITAKTASDFNVFYLKTAPLLTRLTSPNPPPPEDDDSDFEEISLEEYEDFLNDPTRETISEFIQRNRGFPVSDSSDDDETIVDCKCCFENTCSETTPLLPAQSQRIKSRQEIENDLLAAGVESNPGPTQSKFEQPTDHSHHCNTPHATHVKSAQPILVTDNQGNTVEGTLIDQDGGESEEEDEEDTHTSYVTRMVGTFFKFIKAILSNASEGIETALGWLRGKTSKLYEHIMESFFDYLKDKISAELMAKLMDTLEFLKGFVKGIIIGGWIMRKVKLTLEGHYSKLDVLSDLLLLYSTDIGDELTDICKRMFTKFTDQADDKEEENPILFFGSLFTSLIFGTIGVSTAPHRNHIASILGTRIIGESAKDVNKALKGAFTTIMDYFAWGRKETETTALQSLKEMEPTVVPMLVEFYKRQGSGEFVGSKLSNSSLTSYTHPMTFLMRSRNIVYDIRPLLAVTNSYPAWVKFSNDVDAQWDAVRKMANVVVTRPEPIGIYIAGLPGQGKSYLSSTILPEFILSKVGLVTSRRQVPRNIYNYPNNPDQSYADGYWGQPFVIYDDLGATREGKDYQQMINLISTAVAPVNMADLKDKGQLFVSPFICCTTNQTSVQGVVSLNNVNALKRRFPFAGELVIDDQYRTPGGNLDFGKLTTDLKQCKDSDEELSLYDSIFRFRHLDILTGDPIQVGQGRTRRAAEWTITQLVHRISRCYVDRSNQSSDNYNTRMDLEIVEHPLDTDEFNDALAAPLNGLQAALHHGGEDGAPDVFEDAQADLTNHVFFRDQMNPDGAKSEKLLKKETAPIVYGEGDNDWKNTPYNPPPSNVKSSKERLMEQLDAITEGHTATENFMPSLLYDTLKQSKQHERATLPHETLIGFSTDIDLDMPTKHVIIAGNAVFSYAQQSGSIGALNNAYIKALRATVGTYYSECIAVSYLCRVLGKWRMPIGLVRGKDTTLRDTLPEDRQNPWLMEFDPVETLAGLNPHAIFMQEQDETLTCAPFLRKVNTDWEWKPQTNTPLTWKGLHAWIRTAEGIARRTPVIVEVLRFIILFCLLRRIIKGIQTLFNVVIDWFWPVTEQFYAKETRIGKRFIRKEKLSTATNQIAEEVCGNDRVANQTLPLSLYGESAAGCVLALDNQHILLNYHYLARIKNNSGRFYLRIKNPMGEDCMWQMCTIGPYQTLSDSLGKPDLCIMRLNFLLPGMRKLDGAFMTAEQLNDHFCGLEKQIWIKHSYGFKGEDDQPAVFKGISTNNTNNTQFAQYRALRPTTAGDCGLPYMYRNKVLGIHTCIVDGTNIVGAAYVSKDTIDQVRAELDQVLGEVCHVDFDPIVVEQCDVEGWTSSEQGFYARGVAIGKDGKPFANFVPNKSSKVKSELRDTTAWPDDHIPVRQNRDILIKRCQKYGFKKPCNPPTQQESNFCKGYWKRVLDMTQEDRITRVLTDHEILNGSEEMGVQPMKRDSSGGIWNAISEGKKDLIDVNYDAEGKGVFTLSEKAHNYPHPGLGRSFVDFVQYREENLEKGWRVPDNLWTTCLKDELKPTEKVHQGKTRVFECSPFDTTWLCKKYFGAFAGWYRTHAGPILSHFIGQDKETNWSILFQHLKHGNKTKGIDIDYKEWDGSVPPAAFVFFRDVVDMYYHDSTATEKQVRAGIIHELQFTQQLVGPIVCQSLKGNKSGTWLTDLFNSCVNHWAWMVSYYRNYDLYVDGPPPTPENWSDDVSLFTLGDDATASTEDDVGTWFNGETIGEVLDDLGFTATGADKRELDTSFKPIEDLTFLKSGFLIAGPVVLPPMPMEIAWRELNWVKKGFRDNITVRKCMVQDALRFTSWHGPEAYDELVSQLRERLHTEPGLLISPPDFAPWQEMYELIWLDQQQAIENRSAFINKRYTDLHR